MISGKFWACVSVILVLSAGASVLVIKAEKACHAAGYSGYSSGYCTDSRKDPVPVGAIIKASRAKDKV
jgi:hypothetical protein